MAASYIYVEYAGQWKDSDFSISMQVGDSISLIGHPFPASGGEDPAGVFWSYMSGNSGAVSMETNGTTATITAAAAGTQVINCAAASNPNVDINITITVSGSAAVVPLALNLYDISDNSTIDYLDVLEYAPNESRTYRAIMILSNNTVIAPTVEWYLDSSETVYSIAGYTDNTVTVQAGSKAGESSNYLFAIAYYNGESIATGFRVNVVGEAESGFFANIYNTLLGAWEEYVPRIYNSATGTWEEYEPKIFPDE